MLLGENTAGFPAALRSSSLRPQSLLEAGGKSSLNFIERKAGARGKGVACQHSPCALGMEYTTPPAGDLTSSFNRLTCKMGKVVSNTDLEASQQHLAVVVSTPM